MSTVRREDFIVPRCTSACPAGVDVPRYIRAVRDGAYDEAVAVVRESIPLPTVCADACFAPCEDACAYKQFGDPIAIRALKRAAVDNATDGWKKNKGQAAASGKKAAVVGAGPAGLTVAYYLASAGHAVTLFDAFAEPGGMMRYGIPAYRLPEDRVAADAQAILDLGVEFKGNTVIGKDISLDQLKSDFDAIFLGSGANASAKIPLDGGDKPGVEWGWEFLRDVAAGEKFDLGKNVAVVGGGNVAIDVALTAKRLGADNVNLFCLESREEMPAHPWEVAVAEEEGVVIHNSWAPKKVIGRDKATGLALMQCTSVFDDACNFSPEYDDDVTFKVNADTVILAVGQAAELGYLSGGVESQGNIIKVADDLATGEDGVFAAGDVVTGPASIIGAIAQGKLAAQSMDRFLGGAGDISEILAQPEDEVDLAEFSCSVNTRRDLPQLEIWERLGNFDQVEKSMCEADFKAEADRCLNCDARKFAVVLNTESCKECGYCVEVCGVETFGPAEAFNVKGYRPMEVKSTDWCVGCFKCFFSCPDFAIDVKEAVA